MSTHFRSTFRSSDKSHDIVYYVVFPSGNVRGVVQIAHGMAEYFERYNAFADFLADRGFVVCGNDHLGHGRSVSSDDDLGYFGGDGWENVVKDMYKLTRIMKKNYPEVPYFIFGHSMGSFLARAYVTRFSKAVDGAVFCGTSAGTGGTEALLTLLDIAKRFKGGRHKGNLFNKLAFGSYNKKIKDTEIRSSTGCQEIPQTWQNTATTSAAASRSRSTALRTLQSCLWYVNSDKWFTTYPKSLPTYLIAGGSDPVGEYGKGVLKVFNKLNLNDCSVEMKIYKDARHELLNETNRQEVYADVLDFFESLM